MHGSGMAGCRSEDIVVLCMEASTKQFTRDGPHMHRISSSILHSMSPLGRQNLQQLVMDMSPPIHRWMKDDLDRSVFQKSITVLAARIPARDTTTLLKSDVLRRYIMDVPKIRSVVWDPSDTRGQRLVLLKVPTETALSPEARIFLMEHSVELVDHTIRLNYDYWTADDILQAVLPEELLNGSPTGFSVTGHIAHLNLNKEYLPYKKIIGQVILDKNPAIKTVVNKIDNIDNKFRFFKMELLAGEPNFVVEHVRFLYPGRQWCINDRLSRSMSPIVALPLIFPKSTGIPGYTTEHDRLVQLFKPEDVVADVFAGVGPFAIPAARKGCAVLANDLNPDSAYFLSTNIVKNNVVDLVRASCEDGRDFIRNAIFYVMENPFPPYLGPKPSRLKEKKLRRDQQASERNGQDPVYPLASTLPPRKVVTHFVMNLPDSALDFLDAFRGVMVARDRNGRELDGLYDAMPMIHCYCFTRELEPVKAEADIRLRVEAKIGHKVEEDMDLHLVRSVAPNKDMYCVSFRLPRAVAFAR
ncbi:S-adenosyl-L-methionine-dependent methyltransferase [Pisolithus albus]|nr:S-adenosyl-L-methionine-dependent methyltransferase [Pisolithus albus]